MVEIAKVPNRGSYSGIGGKDIHHVAWYDLNRGLPPHKSVCDVVTDDGTVYRFTRFGDSEPWVFDHRVASDGSERDTARRRLPAEVAHAVDVSDDVLYS